MYSTSFSTYSWFSLQGIKIFLLNLETWGHPKLSIFPFAQNDLNILLVQSLSHFLPPYCPFSLIFLYLEARGPIFVNVLQFLK